jgi:hypothetical protein
MYVEGNFRTVRNSPVCEGNNVIEVRVLFKYEKTALQAGMLSKNYVLPN